MSLWVVTDGMYRPYNNPFQRKDALKKVRPSISVPKISKDDHSSFEKEQRSKGNSSQHPHDVHQTANQRILQNSFLKHRDVPNHHKKALARHFMSSPVHTLEAHSPVEEAMEIMKRYSIRHIPIHEKGEVIGLVSQRDLIHRDLTQLTAQDIMATQLIVAQETTPIEVLAKTLAQEKIGCLPIINHHRILKGIISSIDILKKVIWNGPINFWI
jgi:CBS domain-containing protein